MTVPRHTKYVHCVLHFLDFSLFAKYIIFSLSLHYGSAFFMFSRHDGMIARLYSAIFFFYAFSFILIRFAGYQKKVGWVEKYILNNFTPLEFSHYYHFHHHCCRRRCEWEPRNKVNFKKKESSWPPPRCT